MKINIKVSKVKTYHTTMQERKRQKFGCLNEPIWRRNRERMLLKDIQLDYCSSGFLTGGIITMCNWDLPWIPNNKQLLTKMETQTLQLIYLFLALLKSLSPGIYIFLNSSARIRLNEEKNWISYAKNTAHWKNWCQSAF